MADEKKFTFDLQKCKDKIHKVREAHMKVVGKPNHNPFIWLSQHVGPLEFLLKDTKNHTEKLQQDILALTETPQPLDPNWKAPAPIVNPITGPVSPPGTKV